MFTNTGLDVPLAGSPLPLRVIRVLIVGKGVVIIWFALNGWPFRLPSVDPTVLSSDTWLFSW